MRYGRIHTDETIAKIRELWLDGWSASQIATKMGDGLNRNKVIGIVDRNNFPKRIKPQQPRAKPKPRTSRKRRQPEPAPMPATMAIEVKLTDENPVEPLPPIGTDKKGIFEIGPHECRWPIGDPKDKDFHFCARPCKHTYCEEHEEKAHAKIYTAAERRAWWKKQALKNPGNDATILLIPIDHRATTNEIKVLENEG